MITPELATKQIGGSLSSFLSPVNDLVTYIVPKFGAPFSDAKKITKCDDPSFDPLIPLGQRKNLRNQIDNLQKVVGINRRILPYCSLNGEFKHFGGRWSLTCPIVHIPYMHLRRNDRYGVFGMEKDSENLKKETWLFTDNETRFLILREVIMIKENDSLLKMAARIGMFAAIAFAIHVPVLGLMLSLPLFTAMFLIHFLVERITQEKIDEKAIDILGKMKKPSCTKGEAIDAAQNCLEKLRRQNLFAREQSLFSRFLISTDGNERFNFSAPSLTTRIMRLEKMREVEEASFHPPRESLSALPWDLFEERARFRSSYRNQQPTP